MKEYRLDKTVFKAQTFEEADMANVYGPEVSFAERFRRAYYLISHAYRFSREDPPKLDRTIYSSRKLQ
jgi:hypothetical protein